MEKVALITGITGQDGWFLSEFLIEKEYKVIGIVSPSMLGDSTRLNKKIQLFQCDLTDTQSIAYIINKVEPDEIYNLAAQSSVELSFKIPIYTADIDALGILRILESVHMLGLERKTRIFQASSAELFGAVKESPQCETTNFCPRNPYGIAKLYGFWMVKNYRESYGMYAVNGIMYNHESEYRRDTFVTRKITLAASNIAKGLQEKLYLGNLDAKRDWGYAKDFIECMWLMLQQNEPEDFVISTGESHTVREFASIAFNKVGISIEWNGKGIEEKGIDVKSGKVIIEVNPQYYRPVDSDELVGNPIKAKTLLNWTPKTSFRQLIEIMVNKDYM